MLTISDAFYHRNLCSLVHATMLQNIILAYRLQLPTKLGNLAIKPVFGTRYHCIHAVKKQRRRRPD